MSLMSIIQYRLQINNQNYLLGKAMDYFYIENGGKTDTTVFWGLSNG